MRVWAPRSRQLSAAWLGLGAVLTTATQLRLGNLIGPGELMLAVWIMAALPSVLRRERRAFSPVARWFIRFWAASLVLLLAGWVAGWSLTRTSPDAARDFAAYALIASIIGLVAMKPGGAYEIRRAGTMALFTSTLVLVSLLLWMFVSLELGPLDLLFRGRFLGWSRNPNQVALAVCAVPFLALYGVWRNHSARARCAYVVTLFGSVLVGVASGSDGLMLAWLAASTVLLGHAWLLAIRSGRASTRWGAVLYVGVPLLGLAAAAADGQIPLRLRTEVERIYSEESSGPERIDLWTHAIQNAAASPLVGLGPGSHSSPSIHTWGNPTGPMEAHNMVVDWGSATGILGVLLLLGLLTAVARRAAGEPPLMAALVALFVLGMAHFYLRHPLIWLYLLFIAEVGRGGAMMADEHRAEPPARPPAPADARLFLSPRLTRAARRE
jgi:O-antigen ligase